MFRNLFGNRFRKQNIEEEFEAHLALESKILQERGLNEEEADHWARRSFGNRSLLAEETRAIWTTVWLERIWQDVQYAIRTLQHSRSFSLAAILSIGLGVGASTAVYSIADRVFLRPLPYENPEQLIWVATRFRRMRMEFLGSPEYVTWRRENKVFQSLAATQAHPGETMLLNGDNAEEVHNARVSANFLRTLGIRPALGRDFRESEELPNGPKAVLISDRLWRDRFHYDPEIVGRSVQMDGQPFTVVGVLPRSFQFPMDIELDVLTTLPVSPTASWHDRSVSTWAVYGRLKPGVSLERARAALKQLLDSNAAGMPPGFHSEAQLALAPLHQHRVENARALISLLVGAVTCLLVIACANVSNLLLARLSARSGEFAIRPAIGAGRARLARQLVTEVVLLTSFGLLSGMLLAYCVLRGFVHYASKELPRMSEVTLDGQVLLIGLMVSFVTALVFGGLPSLRAGRLDIQRVLQRSERIGLVNSSRISKQILVAGEMALCLVLLSGAALLLQSLWHLRNDRLGFAPEHVLEISVPIKGTKFESGNRDALIREFLDFVRHVPGTEAVSQTECTPLTAGPQGLTFSRSDRPLPEAFHVGKSIHVCGTRAEYSVAAGLRILRGRFFSEGDSLHPNRLAVLNETAAESFFPGETAVGKEIMRSPTGEWKMVIGVVSDTKNLGLDAPTAPQVFVNGVSYPESTKLEFLVRSLAAPHALESAISAKLRSIDSGSAAQFEPTSKTIAEVSGGPGFNAVLVGSFAVIAFLMAVIGVYGVIVYAVSQRTQEIGIRIALGGGRGRIFRLVLQEGLRPVFIGILAGVGIALGVARYVQSVLHGVSATDPVTFVMATLTLILTAAIAISIPALQASRVDPAVSLRHQ